MKRALVILLGIVMSFELCACGKNEERESRERKRPEPTASAEPVVETPDSVIIDEPTDPGAEVEVEGPFDFYSEATEDWQYAYKDILDNYREKRADYPHVLGAGDYDIIFEYLLCDMSGDGVPELLIKMGTCEADYNIDVYTYTDGEAVYVDNIGAGHTSYYSVPNGDYILCWSGHMGYSYMSTMALSDGQLVFEEMYEEDINETGQEWYTSPAEIVEGATNVSFACYCLDMPLIAANGPIETGDGLSESDVAYLVDDMISNDGMVFPVYVYHFREEPDEPMHFSEFVGPGNANEYGDEDLTITESRFADINGDGQVECLASLSNDAFVVFSIQDNTIYAYVADYVSLSDIDMADENGFHIKNDYQDSWDNIIFDKEQAYYTYGN